MLNIYYILGRVTACTNVRALTVGGRRTSCYSDLCNRH